VDSVKRDERFLRAGEQERRGGRGTVPLKKRDCPPRQRLQAGAGACSDDENQHLIWAHFDHRSAA
jgi:hypothetical protein